jgi:hypothetical protein
MVIRAPDFTRVQLALKVQPVGLLQLAVESWRLRGKRLGYLGGSAAVKMRPPSSGGMGSRLKRARKTLIITE